MKETKFKQTEVGMIPSDWEVKFLSEIGSFSKGSGISRSESNSGNLPAIRYGEIYTKHNDYIKAFYSHISKEVANKSTRIYRGDVLFSASGETKEDIGKTVAFLESIEAYAGGDIIIMSPKCPVNSMFLGYILNFPAIAKQKAMKAQGDAVVHITTDSLRKLQVCIPKTTKEQQRIANALSDIDTLIANLEKLIAKKKNIKQGAMQQLLTGKKRLPGFAPAKPTYKQTELGKIPADWEVKKLKECVSSFIVPMRDKPTLLNGPIPWCRIEDFDGTYLYGSKSNQGVDLDTVKKMNLKIYPVGTLIVSCSAYLGKCAIVGKELITNQTFIGLVPMKQTDVSFLYYRMTSEEKRLNDMATGTTITYLSREQFENFEVIFPSSLKEQTAIANVLSDMDAEISALETKLAKYRTLKTGMMQQLLTGKIRLVK